MVECGFHHLVVTGAGEQAGRHSAGRRPRLGRGAQPAWSSAAPIDEAATVDDVAAAAALLPSTWLELYDTGVSVMHIAALLSAVIDAIMLRLIELTDIGEDAGAPPHGMAAAGLGRAARTLPRSDVDTALVWEDLPDGPDPAGKLRSWAGRVLDNMERLIAAGAVIYLCIPTSRLGKSTDTASGHL